MNYKIASFFSQISLVLSKNHNEISRDRTFNETVEYYVVVRSQGGERMGLAGILFSIGMLLSLVGFALTFVGTIWGTSQRSTEEEETRRIGGLVMIGPIPIIFGSDSKISKLLLKIAVGLFILFFTLLFISPFFG